MLFRSGCFSGEVGKCNFTTGHLMFMTSACRIRSLCIHYWSGCSINTCNTFNCSQLENIQTFNLILISFTLPSCLKQMQCIISIVSSLGTVNKIFMSFYMFYCSGFQPKVNLNMEFYYKKSYLGLSKRKDFQKERSQAWATEE